MTEGTKLYTKNFILLCLSNFLLFAGFYFLMPTLPIYMVKVLGASKGQVGYILAAYTLSSLMIRPFTGYWIDRVGRKWVYLVSLALFGLTLGLYPFATSTVSLIALRFYHGFLWGITTVASATAAVDVIPPSRRGEGIGMYGLSITISLAAGPLMALAVMGEDRYHAMFYSSMAVALLGFVLLLFVRFPLFERQSGSPLTFANMIETRTIPMALVQLLFGITYGGIVSFIMLYAEEVGIREAGPYFLIFAAGIASTRVGSGYVFDRHGPKLLLSTGLILLMGGFLMLALLRNHYGFYGSAFLCGFGGGVILPTLQAMANNMVEIYRRGSANATIITAFDLGIGLGSLVLGVLADAIGLGNTYLVCSLIVFAALIYFLTRVNRYYCSQRTCGI